jgi:hypothetical protein
MNFTKTALPLLLATSALTGGSAFAATGVQYTSWQAFSGTGSGTVSQTLTVPKFDIASTPGWQTNQTLVSFQYDFKDFAVGGNANLIAIASGVTASTPLSWALKFDSLLVGAPFPGGAISNSGTAQLDAPTGGYTQFVPTVVPITMTNPVSFMNATPSALAGPAYTSPPAGNLTVDFTQLTPTIGALPAGLAFISFAPTYSGQFRVKYNYTYDSTVVPGPLPILAAGTAFGFSRRLRSRMKAIA